MHAAVRTHTGELVRAMGGSGVSCIPGQEGTLGNDDLDEAMLEI